ncbi:MAG: HlyD family efflux transporter periplasmic adaptor subunit [Magnetococcales bacterium]|nr:HlyD family efflux transporter periplasmic adaptor subunit [Magnetococcales bacterium]
MHSPHHTSLREELTLHVGPKTRDGSPTWSLHDPVNNRFYRLDWPVFEILARWSLADPTRIIDDINRTTTLQIDSTHLADVERFLNQHQLLNTLGQSSSSRVRKPRRGWMMRLLHGYLFFRIPLVRPEGFLNRTLPLVDRVFSRGFLLLMLVIGGVGLYQISRQWDLFLASFAEIATLQGALGMAAALVLTKTLHELGHAYAARRFGCHVPVMGVAFLVMWPVLYTDVTDSWKLNDKRQRMLVGSAGMLSELALASIATLAWNHVSPGPLQNTLFFIAVSSWLVSLTINANPFMKFDGYFVLSDWLEVENLHERATALGQWRLREMLWGLGDSPPEPLSPRMRRSMILFAWATWIYRLILFLGIALLVYQLFFKLLGLFLMVVEVVWFIIRPVFMELRRWTTPRYRPRLNSHAAITILALCVVAIITALPITTRLALPAIYKPEQQRVLYAPTSGQVESLPAALGDSVAKGDPLITLFDPDMAFSIEQSSRLIAMLEKQLAIQGMGDTAGSDAFPLLRKELETAYTRRQGLFEQRDRLVLTAPFDGRIARIMVQEQGWVREKSPLIEMTNIEQWVVEAYLPESDYAAVRIGDPARFRPEMPEAPEWSLRVSEINTAAVAHLSEPILSSRYGGDVATWPGVRDNKLVPVSNLYRLRLSIVSTAVGSDWPVMRGTVMISGDRQSLYSIVRSWITDVLIQESVF